MTVLDNVHGRLVSLTVTDQGWKKEELPVPGMGTVGVMSASDERDVFFFSYSDFLTRRRSSSWRAGRPTG